MEIKLNAKAPNFDATLQDGRKVSLKDYAGKWLILYFYPKDNTSGCTTEACNFRDEKVTFEEMDAEILGVSADNAKSHLGFIEKNNLNFDLITDPDKEIIQAYGVWREKTMCGRTSMAIARTTFIIDPNGKIAAIFENVKAAKHSED